jgi:hypothetical protein
MNMHARVSNLHAATRRGEWRKRPHERERDLTNVVNAMDGYLLVTDLCSHCVVIVFGLLLSDFDK